MKCLFFSRLNHSGHIDDWDLVEWDDFVAFVLMKNEQAHDVDCLFSLSSSIFKCRNRLISVEARRVTLMGRKGNRF